MIPTRWSSAIAILRRRLRLAEEERRLWRERRRLERQCHDRQQAGDGVAVGRSDDGGDDSTEPRRRWLPTADEDVPGDMP